jgi:hypothetical protein
MIERVEQLNILEQFGAIHQYGALELLKELTKIIKDTHEGAIL